MCHNKLMVHRTNCNHDSRWLWEKVVHRKNPDPLLKGRTA
jgi:hypothetical protein